MAVVWSGSGPFFAISPLVNVMDTRDKTCVTSHMYMVFFYLITNCSLSPIFGTFIYVFFTQVCQNSVTFYLLLDKTFDLRQYILCFCLSLLGSVFAKATKLNSEGYIFACVT